MKKLLCILLLSAIALAQTNGERRHDECKAHSITLESDNESLKLLPGFLENHSAFAQGADFYTHADAGFRSPFIRLFKSGGTRTNPTPVPYSGIYEADSLGGINFGGWDGMSYFNASAAILTLPDENWTSTAHGGHLSIYGTDKGRSNTHEIAQFGGNGPNNEANVNVILFRGLVFKGAQNSQPGIIPGVSPPVIKIRTADDSADAALTAGSFVITTPHTPATAFEACDIGQIAWDANFVYVCVAPNTWRRSSLAAW
jgi:hypothetical protein